MTCNLRVFASLRVFAAIRVFVPIRVFVAGSLAVPLIVRSTMNVRAQEQQPSAVQRWVKRVLPPDQGGGFHFTRHLAVVFGGIKPGQGIALGPAVSTTFHDGGYAQLKGVYSVRNFRLVQARYDTRPFWHGRSLLVTRGRLQDAPKLDLFELGRDSPRERAHYGEQKNEMSAALATALSRAFSVTAGAGFERYAISSGMVEVGENHAAAAVPLEPGLSTRTWFSHVFVGAALDTRKAGYGRSGTTVDATAGNYRDLHDGTFSFQRLEGGARQFVAMGSRGSAGVSARAWISHAGDGHTVPFFLMPTLGGGDGLEAFALYRYRDRNALLVKGEYRHAVYEMIDAVGFYEAGTVAPAVRTLSSAGAAHNVGAGVIVHTKDATLLRFDLAHGREGFGVVILFSMAGGS